ncbi:MAG: DNA translocase FtsK 4TM domain-containing protein, partial [Anaerovoracaceae bacterium]|nr:DNA translocase FtsK 4TM domain-containing protein [Anaerovoracaceae bacterium]
MAGKRAPGRQTGSKNKKYKGNNRETMELSVQSSSSRSGKTAQKSSSKKSSGTKKGSGQKGGGQKSTGPSAAQGRSASGKTQGRHKGIPNEITGIIMLALGVFLVIAFHTNVAGVFGEMISGFFKGLFGLGAFVIPYLMVIYSVLMLVHRTGQWKWTKGVWMLIFVMGADLVNSGRFVSRYMSGFPDFKAIYDGGVQLNNGGLFGTYAGG